MTHASDCAVHNEPAGECGCGVAIVVTDEMIDAGIGVLVDYHGCEVEGLPWIYRAMEQARDSTTVNDE